LKIPEYLRKKTSYHYSMGAIHITEAEATGNFAAVMAHIRAGEEVVIDCESTELALIKPIRRQPGRPISEILALAKLRNSDLTLDEGFAKDIEEIINNQEAFDPPQWD
jgi:antitoxin (DNA-binding transcriptional repressor) of toxin-antitoxin stability system